MIFNMQVIFIASGTVARIETYTKRFAKWPASGSNRGAGSFFSMV